MSALDGPISAAVEMVWKIAATVARRSGSEKIEVHHFLFGIFSLDRGADLAAHPPESRADLLAELSDLQSLCATLSINFQPQALAIHRSMSLPMPGSRSGAISRSNFAISRSAEVRETFERAATFDRRNFRTQIRLAPLLRYLLEANERVSAILALDQSTCQHLVDLLSASDPKPNQISRLHETHSNSSAPGISILQAIDADQQPEFDPTWSIAGKALASLCELNWKAGTDSPLDLLLVDSMRLLFDAAAAAVQAAVMTIGPSGRLALAAQHPQGDLPVSLSPANMAIRQRKAFIWQRRPYPAADQSTTGFRAGVYAPILANGEIYGVVCLDAAGTASNFTSEHLFLVTSLGRQLGLAFANRNLADAAPKKNSPQREADRLDLSRIYMAAPTAGN
jgi:GAF domain-containing protein